MKKTTPTLLLLDGNALLHRAWHALPPLTTNDGTVVNAVYGFAMVIEKMRETLKPDYMAVAWDLPGETFRHKLYKEYKATRKKKEQELYDQIPIIQELLEAYKIPSVDAEGYEADDVIGTMSAMGEKNGWNVDVVTGDLDALQLVSDQTAVVFFQKGISQTKLYDEEAVKERYGLSPDQVIDYKAMRGDTSDNIPGIKGVGDKTATTLLKEYGTLERVFEALDAQEVETKLAKKLEGQKQAALDSKELVTIVRDIDLDIDLKETEVEEPDAEALVRLYQQLEFARMRDKYKTGSPQQPEEKKKERKQKQATVVVTRSEDEVRTQLNALQDHAGIMLGDQQADLFGSTKAALAISDGVTTCVIPNPDASIMKLVLHALSGVSRIVTHGYKQLLHQTDGALDGRVFDTQIAAYLLKSGTRQYDLPSIVSDQINRTIPDIPESFGSKTSYQALGQIASVLPALADALASELEEVGMTSIFQDMEMPLSRVLYAMETQGIAVDTQVLTKLSGRMEKMVRSIEKQVYKLAGSEFNLNSPSQLQAILFDEMDLPTKGIKKTKTGYSTAASELEKLWDAHKIIPLISEYREYAKLKSTYVDVLPNLIGQDGRIHTTFNQTVTATGRLSSSDPNLQNIPIKSEIGREIRSAFVAPRGMRLVAADYSQIELRLVAVIAKDKPFINAFNEGADIHTRTAAEIFEVAETDVTTGQRRAAKAINFGLIYGMGPRSLSQQTEFSFQEAKQFIEKYFSIHHAVRTYLDETKVIAHEQGYVESLFGRRRYLPEIDSGVPRLIAGAERMAINMPIQGTQADIIKKAMLEVNGWLRTSDLPAKMLLQVHDELVLEVDKDAVEAVGNRMKEIMEGVADFDVPLSVDLETGTNWGNLQSV